MTNREDESKVAEALKQAFKDSVSENAGMPFEATGVSVPSDAIWLRYARAALSTPSQGGRVAQDTAPQADVVELPNRLRETTHAMASFASVDMTLWDRHSNACLKAATEIETLTNEEARLRNIALDLQNERLVMLDALKPFASCADEIDYNDKERDEPTPDGEWAKFRLLVSDYRRARAALNVPTHTVTPSPQPTSTVSPHIEGENDGGGR